MNEELKAYLKAIEEARQAFQQSKDSAGRKEAYERLQFLYVALPLNSMKEALNERKAA